MITDITSFRPEQVVKILLGSTVFENQRKSLIQHCERSYVYILSGQKFIKNAKNGPF